MLETFGKHIIEIVITGMNFYIMFEMRRIQADKRMNEALKDEVKTLKEANKELSRLINLKNDQIHRLKVSSRLWEFRSKASQKNNAAARIDNT